MKIEQAIQKAIEGGLDFKVGPAFEWDWFIEERLEWLLMKPEFWKGLGKSMGFEPHDLSPDVNKNSARRLWHKLIDHLAEGKELVDFFKELD